MPSPNGPFRSSVALKVLGAQIARLRASASAIEIAFAAAPAPGRRKVKKNKQREVLVNLKNPSTVLFSLPNRSTSSTFPHNIFAQSLTFSRFSKK